VVSNQLKSAVVVSCPYEPKEAKIEVAEQIVERWILARLRKEAGACHAWHVQ
jgi:hypothetical protein